MKNRDAHFSRITGELLQQFAAHLQAEERSTETIAKYLRAAKAFSQWLGERGLTKACVVAWKESLQQAGRAPVTINGMLAGLHSLLAFMGENGCRVKTLHVQRRLFSDPSRALSRSEYERLVSAAQKSGREKLSLLIETLCATGVRVSEARFLTVEAAAIGRAEISLKGKVRVILLPSPLRKKLLHYCRNRKIQSGPIFLSRQGRPLHRRQIWEAMKRLSVRAGVDPRKVFPHNLRHLFARTFYKASRDIALLADVLGHSSIETTRIYLVTTGAEHAWWMNRLGLVT